MRRIIKALFFLLMPGLAFADTSGLFTPVADDISVKVINQIFGGLVNGGNDAFGSSISTFNSAILIIGGILATYTLLAGTLGTAHDGEMLGKKFSSVWIPIRYSLGTALVLPVLGGGYCVMQQLVMWLVMQGVGLADMVWDSYMQTPGIAANMSISKNTEDKARALAENIFMAEVCVEANKYAVSKTDNILTIKSRYDYNMVYDSAKRTYNFGDQKGIISSWSTNDCGEVTFGEKIQNSTVASGPSTSNVGYLGPLDNLFAPTDVQPINQAHEEATKALITAAKTAATSVVNNDGDIDAATAATYYQGIDTATKDYLTSIKTAANAVAMSPSDTTKTAHKYGWFMAGAYFMNTVVTNNKITNAIAAVPDSKFSKSAFNDQSEALQANGLKVLAAGNPIYGSAANAINQKKANESAKETEELGFGGRIMNAITSGLTSIDLYQLKNDPRHPVIVINEMGSRLQAYWTGMVMTLIAVTGAAGIAALLKSSIATTVTNVLVIIVGFLGLPIMALAATSFTASYLIPMMPFMMWLGILGGWLIAVVIAVIAAPLWAIMHLHPNGDDLTGRGGNGYMMVLGLLLRPCLAIFGFIAAIVISSVMGEFINKVFFQVFSFSQGDGKGLGFFIGVIAGAAIYVAIMFSFIKKTFGLMHVIPDELMRWIGGGGDQLGHYAGKMGEGSTGAVGAVAAFTAGRGLSQNMQNTGRQVTDQIKAGRAQREAAAAKDVEGVKGFNSLSSGFDKAFGAGQGDRISSMLGIDDKNINSERTQKNLGAFNQGMTLASEHGGEEGKEAFMNAMEEDSANGFAAHGGAAEAATFHSQNIASNAMVRAAEAQFGSAAGEYLHAVAPHKDGDPNLLDLNKAGKAVSDLGKAQGMLGGNFQSVLSQAVENHASNPSAMNSFIAGHYNEAKAGAQEITSHAASDQEGLPPVVETPIFNPETNQIEGGASSAEPQQTNLDFTQNNNGISEPLSGEQSSASEIKPPQIQSGDINDV
jgi:conjugal transfer/type IV secretion protein DotA/TraY